MAAARGRALTLIAAGALLAAGAELLLLLLVHPWALAEDSGRWPLREFLTTEFGLAGLGRVALALALAAGARWIRRAPAHALRFTVALGLGVLLMANAAWLAHAVSRLHDRGPLMVGTVLHQLGAMVWVGGLLHLVGFALLWRRAGGPSRRAARRARARALLGGGHRRPDPGAGPGPLPLHQLRGRVGRPDRYRLRGHGADQGGAARLRADPGRARTSSSCAGAKRGQGRSRARVPAFIEAEVGLGLTLLLAAASLTSLPPSVDVVADRATPAEVAARFRPAMPRLSSPPVAQLLAAAAPMDDTLAKRQPEEYAWSEYNHHAAGFFVFTMGLLALLDRTGRARWARHWPLGFLGLAAFLFVRNDPRAWPLGPAGFWESMVVPDVLQHRLVVLLVVALAVFEWMVRSARLTRPGGRLVFPLLCASGGALLLTHSHAMFNLKTEFLAEVSHAPMGLLGVVMAWGRWLEVRLPAADGRIPGWIWAACMTAVGLILLVYRET